MLDPARRLAIGALVIAGVNFVSCAARQTKTYKGEHSRQEIAVLLAYSPLSCTYVDETYTGTPNLLGRIFSFRSSSANHVHMLPGDHHLRVVYSFVRMPMVYRSKKSIPIDMKAKAGHTYCLRSNLDEIKESAGPVIPDIDERIRIWVEDLSETGGKCGRELGRDRGADRL